MGIKSEIIKELAERAKSGLLDMSQTARMTRAREQGFDVDTTYYHGTSENIEAFDLSKFGTNEKKGDVIGEGFFFSKDPDTAALYAEQASKKGGNPNIIETFLKMDNPLVIKDKKSFDEFIEDFPLDKNIPPALKDHLSLADQKAYSFRNSSEKNKAMYTEAKGYDGFVDERYPQAAVLRPDQIRSTNAAFDPSKKSSSNLLASSPAAAIGGGALAYQASDSNSISSIIEELKQRGASGLISPQDALRLKGGDVGGIEGRSIRAPSIFGPVLDAIDRASSIELPIIGKPLEGVGEYARNIGFESSEAAKLKRAVFGALDLI